jgi:LPXTG-site transpeptidase (sortase) family protein
MNQPTRITRKILLTIVITGYAIAISLLFQPAYAYLNYSYHRISAFVTLNNELHAQQQVKNSSLTMADIKDMRLKIPSIGVDAPIELLKLNPQGAVGTPSTQFNVGLYKMSSSSLSKDQKSIVVIDGHRGWYQGGAVFDNLHKLKVGDKVYIEDKVKGIVRTFIVEKNHSYDQGEDTPDVFSQKITQDSGQQTNIAKLNLITCDGDWDPVTKSYKKRLVVFTEEVS